jgi:hypothetical protein
LGIVRSYYIFKTNDIFKIKIAISFFKKITLY